MSLRINTNVEAFNAHREMLGTSDALAKSMEKLSSGLRINRAADDAAGLAISEKMRGQIRGLAQANRNSQDGISLVQTAEGALNEIHSILQRVRELAVQYNNGTLSTTDHAAITAEIAQLSAEASRIVGTVQFNGISVLAGTATITFQVGANSGETITATGIVDATTGSLGSTNFASDTLATSAATNLGAVTAGNITIQDAGGNPVSIGALPTATSAAERLGQLAAGINNVSGKTGVNAYVDTANSTLVLTSKNDIQADAIAVDGTQVADLAAIGLTTNAGATAAATVGIDTLDISSFAGSSLALQQIDSALDQVNSSRASLGALQSRFENAASNIAIQSENTSAARGRIVDADFAAETANMSRAQILQQAGTAMVAQANQLPQQVLQLLKG
jgi:flagellin